MSQHQEKRNVRYVTIMNAHKRRIRVRHLIDSINAIKKKRKRKRKVTSFHLHVNALCYYYWTMACDRNRNEGPILADELSIMSQPEKKKACVFLPRWLWPSALLFSTNRHTLRRNLTTPRYFVSVRSIIVTRLERNNSSFLFSFGRCFPRRHP